MDTRARNLVKRHLEPGERLLWFGRPRLRDLLCRDLVLALRGGARTGGTLAAMSLPFAAPALLRQYLRDGIVLPGLVAWGGLLAIALVILLAALAAFGIASSLTRARRTYAITSRRLLILKNPSDRPDSITVESAGFHVRPGRAMSSGDVTFMDLTVQRMGPVKVWGAWTRLRFGFDGLPDIRPVQRAFEQARRLAEREAG